MNYLSSFFAVLTFWVKFWQHRRELKAQVEREVTAGERVFLGWGSYGWRRGWYQKVYSTVSSPVMCCGRRLFLEAVFSVERNRPGASAGQREAAVGLRPIVSLSGCRAVQVSWFKGCSLRQEIVSCSEVYCNKVHSPRGMCCWVHESLYGLAVLTSALWFIHAIPQQEWQKCNQHMVVPAPPVQPRWALTRGCHKSIKWVCSERAVSLVLPESSVLCVCEGFGDRGILLLLGRFFTASVCDLV